jgi:N-acyl-D-aspartate/D-glutamate deacylase
MQNIDDTIIYDTIIENGLVFDGKGNPPALLFVGIREGKVTALSREPLLCSEQTKVIDAEGCWVTPGFIDFHTHYDAEVEISPSLSESVRHGVTTVALGSCSLSLAMGSPEDLADMFCRVEAIPYDVVRNLLEEKKSWDGVKEYMSHLESLPLGPNVASFLGHSCLRAYVMGIERSLDNREVPTEKELQQMEQILSDALDEGYMGLSIQTLPWDKMGGNRAIRSRPLPSTFAHWSEYRRLNKQLRSRGKIFQGVPNVSTKVNVLLFLLESTGLFRKPLKTTVISMMDARATRGLHKVVGLLSRVCNRLLGGNFKWQALPEVFDLWADGIDLVVFEEFGAGAAALHVQDAIQRRELLQDPKYRAWFKAQWKSLFLPKVFHRDFNQSEILACPDQSLVSKSFSQVAIEHGTDAAEVFLDLVAQHGTALRWYTVMANDRLPELEYIMSHPDVLIGFSDAGAHLRNMAHYNFPLRMLRHVRNAIVRNEPFMSVERAVYRLTSEIAEWFGLDAGTIEVGKRADIVVIHPASLNDDLEKINEATMEGFPNFTRLVRRNDHAVKAVLIRGKEALRNHQLMPQLGKEHGFGTVLRCTL